MANIQRRPPNPGTYTYVLRRYDLACIVPQNWSTYDEATQSRAIVLEGVEAQTLFLRDKAGAHRATILGWTDETTRWHTLLEGSTPSPTTEPQRKILAALAALPEGWTAKREIVAAAGIADSEWRTAIAYLDKLGLVECNNNKRKTATNRSYRYRLTDAGRLAAA